MSRCDRCGEVTKTFMRSFSDGTIVHRQDLCAACTPIRRVDLNATMGEAILLDHLRDYVAEPSSVDEVKRRGHDIALYLRAECQHRVLFDDDASCQLCGVKT